jgi:hypothetical protein
VGHEAASPQQRTLSDVDRAAYGDVLSTTAATPTSPSGFCLIG